MSKLNIIQRRELEPLMLKAGRIIKHYEKASNCAAFVMRPESDSLKNDFNTTCSKCNEKNCMYSHTEAINKAKQLGGSYIYLCNKGLVFWTSPFYSGERFAGALLSGGMKKTDKNYNRVKSLAHIMLLCADQISGLSFVQKNTVRQLEITAAAQEKTNLKKPETEDNYIFEAQPTPSALNPETEAKDDVSTLDMERMLLACLRRGDKEEGLKILVKLLKLLYQQVKNNFQPANWLPVFKLKALELAILLSRAASDPKDIKDNTSLETTNHIIKKIEESATLKEITEILSVITERMSGKIFSFHGVRHFAALRKAERYIWTNYTRKLSLKEIASASGLSAPYFSTVFKEEMGENLSNYLNRLRVEKAVVLLVTTDQPISEIARICGFEDQSWFSKIFKNNTGLTPGKYRELGMSADGNILE